ncbi:hypothetical protein EBU94_09195 [bacterium]|nr:hypothetical protein [bacterium]
MLSFKEFLLEDKCSGCGNSFPGNLKYCPSCGADSPRSFSSEPVSNKKSSISSQSPQTDSDIDYGHVKRSYEQTAADNKQQPKDIIGYFETGSERRTDPKAKRPPSIYAFHPDNTTTGFRTPSNMIGSDPSIQGTSGKTIGGNTRCRWIVLCSYKL